ncbi:SAM-dependent methyltransferase [bacterium]|nr:SAM-dependent methyltransferase [bacterium]
MEVRSHRRRLHRYVCTHRSNAADPLLAELRSVTDELGDESRMQISEEQGNFLQIITATTGVRRALEIGTFTGYSSLCIARGLPSDGQLTCLDVSREWTDIARDFWRRAGVAGQIDLKIGPALESLKKLDDKDPIDLVFIDAAKEEYDAYFEAVLPRVRANGLILFDNMLWGGRLGRGPIEENSGRAIDALNKKLATDPRVESVLLTVADGIQMCRVK